MLGAIIGDIVGSRFEFHNTNKYNFKLFDRRECFFTDDTICTVAIADALLSGSDDYASFLQKWCRKYNEPIRSFGGSFGGWIWQDVPVPYNSFGNGAAMRVSPISLFCKDDASVIRCALGSAAVSHNHPEGLVGAMAVALAGFRLMRAVGSNEKVEAINSVLDYFYKDVDGSAPGVFDETCQGVVPVALRIVRDSLTFEQAIRTAIVYGGDSDTLAAIVGGMAETFFGIPKRIKDEALDFLPADMKSVVSSFYASI